MNGWVTKQDWEAEGERELRTDKNMTPRERALVEFRINERKSNRMTPSQKATWRRLYSQWQSRLRDHPYIGEPPLSWEIRMEDPGGDVSLAFLTDYKAYLDENRYYAATILNKSRALFILAVLFGCIPTGFFGTYLLLAIFGGGVPADRWLWIAVSAIPPLCMWWFHKRVNRAANHVFERHSGRVYLFRSREAHSVYDFHRLYWTLRDTWSGSGTNTALMAFDVNPETGEVRSSGTGDEEGEMLCQFTLPTREEALVFWQSLVRFMDKDWVFDELKDPSIELKEGPLPEGGTTTEYLEWLNAQRNKYGYKVEGVRFSDGTAEWLLPGDDRLYLGPWYENLRAFKRKGKQFRLKTAPPGGPETNGAQLLGLEARTAHD